jgi:hypothetical protein
MLWQKTGSTKFRILFSITLAIVLFIDIVPNPWQFFPETSTNLLHCYRQIAPYSASERPPVIVIPGFIGSSLANLSHEILWGTFDLTSDFTQFALPLEADLATQQDELIPEQVLPSFKMNLFGWQFEQDMYRQMLHALETIGGRCHSTMNSTAKAEETNDTCFQFPYDWRQDNVKNAQRLYRFILEKQSYLRQKYPEKYGVNHADIKFDIVAHSMGGLLTRYFLRYGDRDLPENGELPSVTWEGARYVNRAILIAPPNAGSLDSFSNLIYGTALYSPDPVSEPILALGVWAGRNGFGPANVYSTRVVSGTFPSTYQMLPHGNYQQVIVSGINESKLVDNLFDIEAWEKMQWGLLSPDADSALKHLLPTVSNPVERRRAAWNSMQKYLKRAEQFTRSLDQPAISPQGLDLELIAGDGLSTPQIIEINRTNQVKVIQTTLGDGIVTKDSALLNEEISEKQPSRLQSSISWSKTNFYTQNHLRLVQNASLIKDLLSSLQRN